MRRSRSSGTHRWRQRDGDNVTATAYLALGSNLGDRAALLAAAREAIAALPETQLTGASAVEETAPLAALAQGAYLNQMLRVETALAPDALLGAVHAIERAAGRDRERAQRWASRTLDIDVVLYGATRLSSPTLVIPHPGLAHRDFWQRELAALGVDWRAALNAESVGDHALAGASA